MHLKTGSSFIRVFWKAPLNTVRKPVIGYLVQTIDDNNRNNVINSSNVANNSCTIYRLKPDTSYQVRVRATNTVGYGFSAYEKIVTKDKGSSFCCTLSARNPLQEKRWRVYIFAQYNASLTQPIKYKESHIFPIFVSVLTTLCMLGVKILELF